jgi:hypothetical protein
LEQERRELPDKKICIAVEQSMTEDEVGTNQTGWLAAFDIEDKFLLAHLLTRGGFTYLPIVESVRN